MSIMKRIIKGEEAMREFGSALGSSLSGGDLIELVGDVGAGKTTFVKGLAKGLGIDEDIQSPTFTISRIYDGRDGLQLAHYDFYRLNDPGILAMEISETIAEHNTVVVIEWGGIVEGVLPEDRITIKIQPTDEDTRDVDVTFGGQKARALEQRMV